MKEFVRRRVPLLPRIGEVFAGHHSGITGFGLWEGGDQDDPVGGPFDNLQGILTEDPAEGTPILTEDGQWIQAENQ